MIGFAKKAILTGAGLTLLSADKLKNIVEAMIEKGDMTEHDAREAISSLIGQSEKAEEFLADKKKSLINELAAFWMYGVLSDKIEEQLEKIAAAILEQWDIPRQEELDKIRERIRELEKAAHD